MGGRVLRTRAGVARHFPSYLATAFLCLLALRTSLLAIALVALKVSPVLGASEIPFPPDSAIVPPATDVAPEIATFSGKWSGMLNGMREHVLVVEQINPPDVVAIYALGEGPMSTWKANATRVHGKIEACTLTLTLPSTATVTYRMRKDSTLDALYERGSERLGTTLKRLQAEPVTTSNAAALDCVPRVAVPKAPARLKGTYRFTSPVDLKIYANATDFEITSQDDYGNITGFFSAASQWATWMEAQCYVANRLPMAGRYDGQKITFWVKGSQNGGGCQDYTRTYVRGKEHYFESKANDGSWSVYYDPAE